MLGEFDIQKSKENHVDKIISIALMSSFIVLTIQYLILISLNLLGTPHASLVQTLSKVIVGLIFVFALPYVLKRNLKTFILIYGVALIVFSYNFLVFPENHAYLINLIFPFFFMALPSFLYVLSIKDINVFNRVTKKAAYLVFVVGTIIGILIFIGNTNVGIYSMALSYYMLLPALVFLGKIFDKGKSIYIIFFIIALLVILALGSRGAILCIAIYAMLRVISPKQIISLSRILVYGVAVIILITSILNYDRILLFVNNMFIEFGIKSRTISLLLKDEVYLSGRDDIVQTVWNAIIQSPFLGIGLAGDYRLNNGTYVHNFFIEVMGNFGIPLGIFLLGILLLILVITFISTKNYNLIALWVCLGLVHLMVSSSYLIDIKFWILMGILFNSIQVNLRHEFKGG